MLSKEETELYLALDDIKSEVRAVATKKKGKSLSELVDIIIDRMREKHIFFTWDELAGSCDKEPDTGLYVYKASLLFKFIDVLNRAEHTVTWPVTGSSNAVELAIAKAMLGVKERFLLNFFDVPEKDLDPAAIIKKERFEFEEARKKDLQKTLDAMHAKIRERVLQNQEVQRDVDDVVRGFVRVNGKPSTNYYEIKTLETAEALSRAIDKLLD